MTEEEIIDTLKTCIASTVGADRDAITLDQSLIDDLGADSLDLLELVFSLEQAFGIEISRGEIEKRIRAALPNQEIEKEGLLTPEAKQKLMSELPEVDPAKFEGGLRLMDIARLLTVRVFLRMVTEKTEEKNAPAG